VIYFKFKWYRIFILFYSLQCINVFSHPKEDEKNIIGKSSSKLDTTSSAARMIDVNNMAMWVLNNGLFAQPHNGQLGLYYPSMVDGKPNRSLGLVFSSGLWLGAIVNDTIRVMVNQFDAEGSPGAIDEYGNPFGRYDEDFRVYKIGLAEGIINNQDYFDWPVEQDAPVDEIGNPLFSGDQTLWCCYTDGYPFGTWRKGRYERMTKPLGAEIHMIVYGWDSLDDMIFIEWEILNKSSEYWEDVYVGVWADCELGYSQDDLTGSDSTLNLVFDYNGTNYDNRYGSDSPALGYMFLQAPIVVSPGDTAYDGKNPIIGYKNLPVKAPIMYKHPQPDYPGWGDDALSPEGPVYLRLQGLDKYGDPMIDPTTGLPTNWGFSGDPVQGTGWLDEHLDDHRFMVSSGPFNLEPGQNQTIALAVVVGQGRDRLESVSNLKENCTFANGLYRYDGILYTEDCIADPDYGTFTIPIGLTNFQSPVSNLEFALQINSEYISIDNLIPSQRIENMDIEFSYISSNKINITISGIGESINLGNGVIFNLTGTIPITTPVGSYIINLDNIQAHDDDSETLIMTSLPGEFNVNRMPGVVTLLEPEDNVILDQIQNSFSWSKPENPDNDSLMYYLHWIGGETPFYHTQDTTLNFNGSHFYKGDSVYQWTVSVDDGVVEQTSPDTFRLTVPDLENLGHIKTIDEIQSDLNFRQTEFIEKEGDILYVAFNHRFFIYELSLIHI